MAIRKRNNRPNIEAVKRITGGSKYMIENYMAGLGIREEEQPNPIGLFVSYYNNRVGFSYKHNAYTLDNSPVSLREIYFHVNNYRKTRNMGQLVVPFFFVN